MYQIPLRCQNLLLSKIVGIANRYINRKVSRKKYRERKYEGSTKEEGELE